MNQSDDRGFLDELAGMPPKAQLQFLAVAAGTIIRALSENHHQSRDAVDKLIIHVERAAGLRL